MSEAIISSSLGMNANSLNQCCSKNSQCNCGNCLSFLNLTSRVGVFRVIQQSDTLYNQYSNVPYQNDSFGNVITYSTISARQAVFSTILMTSNIADYVTKSANEDKNGFTTLYDVFVSDYAAFSSIILTPTNYTSYSTICKTFDTGCCGSITDYANSDSPITLGLGMENRTRLGTLRVNTTTGFMWATSSMEFTNSDSSPQSIHLFIEIDGSAGNTNTFLISGNSNKNITISLKNTLALSTGTYTVNIVGYLNSGSGTVTGNNINSFAMGNA